MSHIFTHFWASSSQLTYFGHIIDLKFLIILYFFLLIMIIHKFVFSVYIFSMLKILNIITHPLLSRLIAENSVSSVVDILAFLNSTLKRFLLIFFSRTFLVINSISKIIIETIVLNNCYPWSF